jgi:hypothetical protein
MSITRRFSQNINIASLILSDRNIDGNVKETKEEHPANASFPIISTLSGRSKKGRDLQKENAFSPILLG